MSARKGMTRKFKYTNWTNREIERLRDMWAQGNYCRGKTFGVGSLRSGGIRA